MTTHERFTLHNLLSDLHEANHQYISSLTAVIEHVAARVSRIDRLLQPEPE